MEPKLNFYLDRAFSKDRLGELDKDQRKVVEQIIKGRPLQIWASLSFLKYDRVKVYTGERIQQYYWDAEKKRINTTKYGDGGYDFNEWLNRLESDIIKEVRKRFRFNGSEQPTKENLMTLIKGIINSSKEIQVNKDAPSLISLMEQFRDKNQKEWTSGFYKIVTSTIEHIKSYETWRSWRGDATQEQKKRAIPLSLGENYNEVWRDFKEYLISENINNSTSNKHLKLFRRLLTNLSDQGIISNVDFKDLPPFKTVESFRIALKENEVETLADFKFTKSHLNKARDLMIVQIFTGQRVGDLPQLLEQIKNGGELHVLQGKGKKRVTIPKYPLLEKHLITIAKRNPKGLEAFSEQKYNEYIKQCCKDAKINKKHSWIELRGDEEVNKSEPRYDLVSSHTCRRTFATITKKRGISDKAIMSVTGHTSHKVFLEYIRIDDEDVNVEFNEKMK